MKCITEQNKILQAEIISWLTPELAMNGTQISIIKQEKGPDFLVKMVFAMLDDLRISLSIKNEKETESLLIDIAIRIVMNYWFLKIEELALFFSGCKEGKYGRSYGRLSSETVFEWLNNYDKERMGIINNEHETVKNADGNNSDRSPEPTLAKNIFDQAVDQKVHLRIEQYKNKSEK